MTPPVAAAFVFCAIAVIVFVVLWWSSDSDLRDHAERLAVIEDRLAMIGDVLDLAGEPQMAELPPLPTMPMPAVHIQDARRAVTAAREANAPRPTPFPRNEGRHRAG